MAEAAALPEEGTGPSSTKAKHSKKRSASDANMHDEAGASKRLVSDVSATAGNAANAAAMQQQQQQQQRWRRWQVALKETLAAAEADAAEDSTAEGSSSQAALLEETSAEEKEAMAALLGIGTQAGSSNDSHDSTMAQVKNKDGNTSLQGTAMM